MILAIAGDALRGLADQTNSRSIRMQAGRNYRCDTATIKLVVEDEVMHAMSKSYKTG